MRHEAGALALQALVLALPVVVLGRGFDGVLLAFWAVVLLAHVSETSASRARRPDSSPPLGAAAAALAQLAVFWAATVEHVLTSRRVGAVQGALGALVFLLGVALRRAAMQRLGERFLDEVSLLPGHRLEMSGIYGVLRHPSESGLLCMSAGTALLLGSWAGAAACLAAVVPGVGWRVIREDRLLARHFCGEFDVYSRRVGALFPRCPRRMLASAATQGDGRPTVRSAPPPW